MVNDKYIIPINEFVKFEAEMIMEADIKIFQVLTVFQELDQTYLELSWNKKNTQQSVTELIELEYYDFAHFKQFMIAISEIQKVCEDYLLFTEKIDYSPANIYYDAALNRYIWRYYPVQSYKPHFELSHLLAIMLIKSNLIPALKPIQNLYTSPNELLGFLTKNVLEQQERESRSFWHRIHAKKNNVHESNQQIKTTHKTTHPILMVKSNPQENYKLYFDNNIIGRDDTCNIHITSTSISRQHALIYKVGQNYLLKDMGSTNGTILNGQPIEDSIQIVNGDCIQIGEKELIFIR